MRKGFIILLIGLFLMPGLLFAASAGTGFSVFIPESLYKYDSGSVSLETGFSTSFSLGSMLEIPFGFEYNKIQGYMVEGAKDNGGTEISAQNPWFMGDSFLPFAKLQMNLPLGPVTFSAFAGGALNLNASLTPFRGNIADDLAPDGGAAALTSLSYEKKVGLGWLAGAEVGFTVDPITVSIFAEYRSVAAKLEMSGAYLTGADDTALTTGGTLDGTEAELVLRGITVGIGGSFAF